MADAADNDLVLRDLNPLITAVATRFRQQADIDSVVSVSGVRHIRFAMGRADETENWRAVFEAAVDESPEQLGVLLNTIKDLYGGVAKSDVERALSAVAVSCLSRITRASHPDLGDKADTLLAAVGVPDMESAAQDLRQTALGIRRLLMRPVLSAACIKISPAVLDPERRRLELADLAVDVVTATDYLLSLLGSGLSQPPGLSLERQLGPNPEHSAGDDETFIRLTRRRLDARAIAVQRAMRLLVGLRSDVATPLGSVSCGPDAVPEALAGG